MEFLGQTGDKIVSFRVLGVLGSEEHFMVAF